MTRTGKLIVALWAIAIAGITAASLVTGKVSGTDALVGGLILCTAPALVIYMAARLLAYYTRPPAPVYLQGFETPTKSSVWWPLWLAIPLAFIALLASIWFGPPHVAEAVIILTCVLGGVLLLGLLLYFGIAWVGNGWTERIVVSHLANVVRQNLAMPTALALCAQSEGGMAGIVLTGISRRLSQGCPLSQAIAMSYSRCPSLVLSLVMAGEQAGQLPSALAQAEDYVRARARWRELGDVNFLPYLGIVLTSTGLLVAGQMVAIIPKFKEIFKDFGAPMPASTAALISICRFLVDSGILAVGSALLALAVFSGMYLMVRPRRVPDLSALSRTADWLRWHTPGWRQKDRNSGIATAARVIRWGVSSGMDLGAAVQLATVIDVNHYLRLRLQRMAELLNMGVPAGEAAEQAGLGNIIAISFAGAQQSSSMEAALRYITDYHDALVSRLFITVRNLIWPAGTLAVGCLVGFVVYAMFQPLIALIDATMQWGFR